MAYRNLFLLLILMGSLIQCRPVESKGYQAGLNEKQNNEKATAQPATLERILTFEYGGSRGSGYTDSLNTNFHLRYIPITITNDSTLTIQVQFAFSKGYPYPITIGNEKFNIFPLPEDWARDRTTDSMYTKMIEYLPLYINNPLLNKTVQPGEKMKFAIGTIYPMPGEIWSIIPKELFINHSKGMFPTCDWPMDKGFTNTGLPLELKLELTKGCLVIPCGQITYLDQ